jgi:polar amino acid transport system substrate-binding protein
MTLSANSKEADMLKKMGFAFVLALAVAGMAFAGGAKEPAAQLKLVVATDATWPPMEMVDENKQIVGFDIDLMNAAAKEGGFTVEFKNTAWDGIFAGLEGGKYDAVISSVTITDERKATMDFSISYVNAGQVLIVKADLQNVEKLADLKGKTAGAQIGTTGAIEIEKFKDVKKKEYDEIGLAIEDLANGRIDGVVCDTPTAASFALQNANYKGRIKIVGKPFTDEFYGVAVKKGNTKVLDAINKGLKKVIDSGQIKTIEAKWLK